MPPERIVINAEERDDTNDNNDCQEDHGIAQPPVDSRRFHSSLDNCIVEHTQEHDGS